LPEQDKVMQLHSMYQEIILDHYRHPHHKGLREPYDAEVHHVNPVCGDEVTVRVRLARADDVVGTAATGGAGANAADRALSGTDGEALVADVSYDALGCSISQASVSVMTDLVIGKTVREALAVGDEFLALMQSRGDVEPDEDTLEDAVAFAGVAKYPARIKCALLGWMAWKDATARALNGKAGQAP
jgi:nitrogen fixation NifU-like protein